ncbi:hypothetical protein Tco_1476872 [Tanacetum coccineum]
MSDLSFADTHNLVVFLSKPAKSEWFEQIVDFLNATPIKYALTINLTIYTSCIKQFWDTVNVKTVNEEVQLQALVDRKKVIINESTIRRDLQLEDAEGTDSLPNATIFEQLTLMRKPKRKDTKIPQSSGPAKPIVDKATNEENVPTYSNDPLLSGKDSLKLNELIELCTNLQKKVLDLETSKTTQAEEITSLKRRVGLSARVVSSEDEGLGEEDASKQERKIHDIDADEAITLENVHDAEMFDVNDLHGDEVFVEKEVEKEAPEKEVSIADPVTTAGEGVTTASVKLSTASPTQTTTVDELTLAQTLIEIRSTRPKAKGIIIHEEEQASTPITSSNDKGKGIMVEEPLKMKKKDQVLFDKQEAIRLQDQFDEEDRIAREKEEANAALNAQLKDIQDKVETDYELAQRLQAKEQEEFSIKEKSKLFQQLLEKRIKFFASKRVEEKRNKPPTKAQQRSIMTTYLKNMAGWKPKDLKTKSFANVQELFEKEMKRVNTFVDFRTELVEGTEKEESSKKAEVMEEIAQESSSKRTGDELEQEVAKKQKMDDDKEKAELQSLMEVASDEEEVAIDAIP